MNPVGGEAQMVSTRQTANTSSMTMTDVKKHWYYRPTCELAHGELSRTDTIYIQESLECSLRCDENR